MFVAIVDNTGMRQPLHIPMPDEDRRILLRRVRSQTAKARDVLRANIVLSRADGFSKEKTARKLGVSEVTVQTWTDRYRAQGLAGLLDKRGRGRKPSIPDTVKERILTEATRPPKGGTRHSLRSMARLAGVSHHTVRLLWHDNHIKPHLVRLFKVSKDPHFAAKFWDVIGLYLNPPEKAVVFCCDEKTQCQALERTQPCLPLGIGHIRTRTHDYIRHGTTTLFAALDYATGNVIHPHHRRHTHREWLAFLKQLESSTPKGLSIEIIADNYATHKHEKVLKWLEKHPRVHVHHTPTSSSWMNLVERFFGEITRDCIRDGSFSSVAELEKANDTYIARHNEAPKRFVWHAKGTDILRKLNASRKALDLAPVPLTQNEAT